MVADVRVEAQSLTDLSKRLKEAGEEGKQLRKELLKGLRIAMKPVIADIRESAKENLPKKGGLADRVAQSKFSSRTYTGSGTSSVRILGKSGYNIAGIDQGRLRHPVFGRNVWVSQSVRPNWFEKPIEKAIDGGIRKEILQVIEDVARKVEG